MKKKKLKKKIKELQEHNKIYYDEVQTLLGDDYLAKEEIRLKYKFQRNMLSIIFGGGSRKDIKNNLEDYFKREAPIQAKMIEDEETENAG